MGERKVIGRWLTLVIALGAFPAFAGCADGGTMNNGRRDGSIEGGMDTGVLPDTGMHDSGPPRDTGPDVIVPERDSAVDAGPHTTVNTCEACTSDIDCASTSYCAHLVDGSHACLPGCDGEFPSCPRGFTCIFDASGTGVHANICAPVGGPCCVDQDSDHYGVGVGCTGPDCNDMDPAVHPDRDEICDGIDTNCNMHVDESPNDCISGRCSPDGDGTYSSVVGATCMSAMCQSGTVTDCALYTCHDGAAMGTTCATMCAPAGTDDDNFCIATAHCDAAVCTTDVNNGGTCDEDTDCSSNHCDNGFCCTSGQCCATTTDCPGSGALMRICDDPTNCQGHHGVVTCVTNTCTAMSGIDDDTACNTSVVAHMCGTFNPIVCTGTDPQSPRDCATMCLADGDCVAAAHCDTGFCIPDRPVGGSCTRNEDCQDGIGCVDGFCCSSSCTGPCEACNVAGAAGTCTAIAAGADPSGECDGFNCNSYYTGFSGNDVCASRQPVTDAEATCDGARHCRTADVLCPAQLPGVTQIDCNDTCQRPQAGTCTGMTAGACDNLDATAGNNTCGAGVCMTSVPACVGGMPNMCMAGMGMMEICDGADNNCNGTVDDGGGALCTNPANHVATGMCNGTMGCSVASCTAGFADYDRTFPDGCECDVSTSPATCLAAHSLGSLGVGASAVVYNGNIGPGGVAYFSAQFPPNAPGARGGAPTISIGGTGFTIQILANCAGGSFACNSAGDVANSGSTGLTTFSFTDVSGTPPTVFSSANQTWPTNVIIAVRRATAATTCGQAAYTLTVTR